MTLYYSQLTFWPPKLIKWPYVPLWKTSKKMLSKDFKNTRNLNTKDYLHKLFPGDMFCSRWPPQRPQLFLPRVCTGEQWAKRRATSCHHHPDLPSQNAIAPNCVWKNLFWWKKTTRTCESACVRWVLLFCKLYVEIKVTRIYNFLSNKLCIQIL